MASGRFQVTKGRWEPVPTTSVERVIMNDGTTLKSVLDTMQVDNAEFADNQEILDLWRLSERPFDPISP